MSPSPLFCPLDLRIDKEDLKLCRLLKHMSDVELDLLATELMLGKRKWTSTLMMKIAKRFTVFMHG